jgi:ferredoxin
MKVEINHETCELAGRCIFFHPDLFVEREDGHPELKLEPVGPEQRQAALDAVDQCPTGSISLLEEE